jgi:Cu+-exporting ATPase
VLPAQKYIKVSELQSQNKIVAMVGDGINDAIALTQADIGIAVGTGSDIAADAADIVLIKNDLRDVATAVQLSKTVFNRIKLNFVWALGYPIIKYKQMLTFLRTMYWPYQ